LPWQSSIHAPAIRHAAAFKIFYPPAPAEILDVSDLANGKAIKKGDILIRLSSPELMRDIARARIALENLEMTARRAQTDPVMRQKFAGIENDIAAAGHELKALSERENQLILRADFDGIITDLNPDLHGGRFIRPDEPIFTMIDQKKSQITAFVDEVSYRVMSKKPDGKFLSHLNLNLSNHDAPEFLRIETIAARSLEWPQLASIYGGPIAAEPFDDPLEGRSLIPRNTQYRIIFIQDSSDTPSAIAETGTLILTASPVSILGQWFTDALALIRAESGLN
jgi:putative peptide zinc metalloprotease protein